MIDLRGSTDGRLLRIDAALAGLLAVACIIPLVGVSSNEAFVPAVVLSLLMSVAVAARRIAPKLAVVLVALGGIGLAIWVPFPVPALLAIPLVVYCVARYDRFSMIIVVAMLGVAGSVCGPLIWTRDLDPAYQFVGNALLMLLCFAVVTVAYLAGRLVRNQNYVQRLDREIATEKYAAAQRQTAQAVELAEGRARVEVAQELHDVLAHSLSVIVVQAEGAKALTTKRPEAAVEALGVIAETGRTSIAEVRRIVAVMRGETQGAAFGPAPTLSQIPDLVAASGDRVSLSVDGELPVVPESLELATFRVVQEALTNFLKHAGPTAQAEVHLSYSPHEIGVAVRDDGIGVLSASDGHGSGVRGMRERVQAMGGTFRAGPRPGGGFEVRAQIPLPSQLGASWLREERTR